MKKAKKKRDFWLWSGLFSLLSTRLNMPLFANKLQGKRNAKSDYRFRSIMYLQLIIIFVLLCVWMIVERNSLAPWIKGYIDFSIVISLLAAVLSGLLVRGIMIILRHYRFNTRPYITFQSDFKQVFCLSKEVPNMEYSVGEKMWKKLGVQNVVFGGSCGKLLIRGQNELGTMWATISFATNAQVICTGDICTLIDYKHYDHVETKKAKFNNLFFGCQQLVVAPDLTPKALAVGCYSCMFKNCTSLKTTPELPANELNYNCYKSMFEGCTSLITAPKLSATVLDSGCYSGMFYGCSSLIKPPELPAKKLADDCYSYMFSGCTSLWTAPELPAMELAERCYSNMFSNCTSLKATPILPATVLVKECYLCMFMGCTSLKWIPQLPATELAEMCYSKMFSDCISLRRAPSLPAIKLAKQCYNSMFSGCIMLSEVTMLAIDIDTKNYLENWLKDTQSIGTLHKNSNAQWDDDDIIPSNWNVMLINSEK